MFFLIGITLSFCFGKCCGDFTRIIQRNLDNSLRTLPREFRKKWRKIINIGDKLTGPTKILGFLEIIFFYLCLFFNTIEGIGIWLVFKVGTKWETWANVVKIPEEIDCTTAGIDNLKYLELRNKMGTVIMQKFLIGTLGNIISAVIGFVVFCLGGFVITLLD